MLFRLNFAGYEFWFRGCLFYAYCQRSRVGNRDPMNKGLRLESRESISQSNTKKKGDKKINMDMKIFFPGGKKVNAIYKGFTIKTDQSEDDGSRGSAPAPFDLFLASIGTCTGIYVLLFCQARHIPTERLKLILHTERNEETKLISKIDIEIQLPEEFPEKYMDQLVRVAEKCTVKKNLGSPPVFDIYTKRRNDEKDNKQK